MPLNAPAVPRRRLHTRRIEVEGFLRDDGLYELEASLTDVKDVDYPIASGLRPAGEPVHLMRVRITIDHNFDIVDAEACSDGVPYPGMCDTIGPVYRGLIGLNLVRGFRRTVGEMFADVRGCTHLTEMLLSLPTAAIQTFATFRRDNEDDGVKPFQLDRCHALETSAAAVRAYYPRWYRAQPGKERAGG
ncbi:DUF2889 domain-containing protein [Thauera mechernichensis]|uniref:DUF2889 domain-containing protein n=1 Tax=Thauera mechernichensis TaxID=82788 RepID=A0ABW3WF23_9RHOO|nr:DUF2889 domain-containing protein [Thauera mechernichensis]MDG3065571.1 DUF2889 domain-containing protein [Thauera mechernichensis]